MFTSMLDASFMKPRPDGELRPDWATDARPLLTATEPRAPRFMAMDARVAASDWRAPRWDAALAMDGRGEPRPATTDWRAAAPPTAIEARATPRTDWRADDGDGDRLGSSSPRRVDAGAALGQRLGVQPDRRARASRPSPTAAPRAAPRPAPGSSRPATAHRRVGS